MEKIVNCNMSCAEINSVGGGGCCIIVENDLFGSCNPGIFGSKETRSDDQDGRQYCQDKCKTINDGYFSKCCRFILSKHDCKFLSHQELQELVKK